MLKCSSLELSIYRIPMPVMPFIEIFHMSSYCTFET